MTTQPDILLLVLDTQRADRLGAYGHGRAISPNLDRFAANGVLFEQAISPAQWTIPSHASMFTGFYPSTHQVTQSSQSLSPDLPHLAEVLRQSGYQTVGFCNNPLVGILNNGFKRGFQKFYNYGGAFPSLPQDDAPLPWPLGKVVEGYTQFLRRISYPVQNFFGRSDLAFRLSLNAWLTPLWSKMANFKGQNARSVQDVTRFLTKREKQGEKRPLFLFLNLMETHLPFWPPGRFIDQVAPYFRDSKEARTIMRTWNREAYRWAAPLPEPLSELEDRVLHDLYDAEVAYQDDYLGPLFDLLAQRRNQENTLTVILADHGDGLGEHGYFGHAFVAYQELVHVPLMMQWPRRLRRPQRIDTPVSTRRVFHTILNAGGPLPEHPNLRPAEINNLTLLHTVNGRDPEHGAALSEVFPPLNFVKAIEHRQPHLLEEFGCLLNRRTLVKKGESGDLKLIQVETEARELYNLTTDPAEKQNIQAERPSQSSTLQQQLQQLTTLAEKQRQHLTAGQTIQVEAQDEQLLQRLRSLGYLD